MSKTNSGLLAYAKAQVGLPYWYGTYGQTATAALHAAKKKQYPSNYTASDFPSQYGKRVHDCVGLIKGYLWSDSATGTPKYTAAQDKSANGMYSAAKVKGKIDTFPGKAGQLVFKGSSTSSITHVGVYDGEGYVYEAKGHAYGVVKTAFKASQWPYWAQCPYTEDDTDGTVTITNPTTATAKGDYTMEMRNLKKGLTGEDVRALQILLIGNGYSCGSYGADGDFGAATDTAVRKYQKDKGLTVDGVAGEKTMTSLLGL